MIELRRNDILATVRSKRPIVRTGVDVNLGPKDTTELMEMLSQQISILKKDIAMDACSETYGPECEGSDTEVDKVSACILANEKKGVPTNVHTVFKCADVEDTPEHVEMFRKCILARTNKSGMLPRGSLAYCALLIKRNSKNLGVHSTLDWRNKYETWARTFDVFREKISSEILNASSDEVKPYRNAYNNYRKQFIANGGKTSAIEIDSEQLLPTWVWWTVGGLIFIVIAGQVISILSTAKSLVGSVEKMSKGT